MTEFKDASEIAEKRGAALSSLVPQLFFDIIARVIPGSVIVVWLALVAPEPCQALLKTGKAVLESYRPSGFLMVWLGLVGVYVVGIVFYGAWFIILHCVHGIWKKCKGGKPRTDLFVEVVEAGEEFSFRHDFVKLKAPVAGSRMTKLKAEIHMSGALAVAFLVCAVIHATDCLSSTTWKDYVPCGIALAAAVGCFASNVHFSRRLDRAVRSYSVLLGFPERIHKLPVYPGEGRIGTGAEAIVPGK